MQCIKLPKILTKPIFMYYLEERKCILCNKQVSHEEKTIAECCNKHIHLDCIKQELRFINEHQEIEIINGKIFCKIGNGCKYDYGNMCISCGFHVSIGDKTRCCKMRIHYCCSNKERKCTHGEGCRK